MTDRSSPDGMPSAKMPQGRHLFATTFRLLLLGLFLSNLSCGFVSTGQLEGYRSNGDELCRVFSEKMQATSSKWAALAWAVGFIGTAGSVLGGIFGAGTDKDKWYRRAAGVLLASLGSLLAATAAYSISRSSAASDASAQATRARIKNEDVEKFNGCLEARAQWLESRTPSLEKVPPPRDRDPK